MAVTKVPGPGLGDNRRRSTKGRTTVRLISNGTHDEAPCRQLIARLELSSDNPVLNLPGYAPVEALFGHFEEHSNLPALCKTENPPDLHNLVHDPR